MKVLSNEEIKDISCLYIEYFGDSWSGGKGISIENIQDFVIEIEEALIEKNKDDNRENL